MIAEDPPILLEKTPSLKSTRSGNKRRKARRASQKIDPNAPIDLQRQQFLTMLGQRQAQACKEQLATVGQDALQAWLLLCLNVMATCVQVQEKQRCRECCHCACQRALTPSPMIKKAADGMQSPMRQPTVVRSPGSTLRDSGIDESLCLESPAPRTDTSDAEDWPKRDVVPPPVIKPEVKSSQVVDEVVVDKRLLRGHVVQTKYVTTVFESLSMKELLDDVQQELRMWVHNDRKAIAVAAEMVWSYPQLKREKQHEIALKDKILAALRHNNRRVLNLHAGCNSRTNENAPLLTFPQSKVRELCGPKGGDCYQGHYAREYRSLLPHGHDATRLMHEPFWSPATSTRPEPARYLLGLHRKDAELRQRFLVAINLVLLSLEAEKPIIFV